jgi:hypothetical protein
MPAHPDGARTGGPRTVGERREVGIAVLRGPVDVSMGQVIAEQPLQRGDIELGDGSAALVLKRAQLIVDLIRR